VRVIANTKNACETKFQNGRSDLFLKIVLLDIS